MRYAASAAVVALLAAAPVAAQQAGPVKEVETFEVALPHPHGHAVGMMGHDHLVVLGAEDAFEGRLVKGAPYQAEAVTEVVQTLGDGNRIVRKSTVTVARDGEGRTRREHSLALMGPMVPEDAPRAVFIHDPGAGVTWVLEPFDKVARKLTRSPLMPQAKGGPGTVVKMHRAMPVPGPGAGGPPAGAVSMRLKGRAEVVFEGSDVQNESLGTRTIEGVEARGTRTTFTIAAGDIGNERPIEVVRERWESPELQTVVLSRHNDPRFGETTYRLTNIQRGEPDRSLFEVPAGYSIENVKEDAPQIRYRIRERRDRTPEQ